MAIIIIIYVLLSVGGLIMLKIGAMKDLYIKIANGSINMSINILLLIGLLLYIMAFATSLIAMKTTNLSFFYPVSAGLVQILVCISSYYILKENISLYQFIGMALILIGVVVMGITVTK